MNALIERCIAFCTELDPAFPDTLRGADETSIAALEAAMGRPLSDVHRAFLERMGAHTGPLHFGLYSAVPSDIVERTGEWLAGIPPDREVFAVPIGDDEDVIELLDPGNGDPAVIRTDDDEVDTVAGSFSELLCLPFLNARYVAQQPLQATYMEKEMRADTLERCRDIAALFGFEPYWFSNATTYTARRDSLVLVARQPPGSFFSAGVAGQDSFAWGVVARALHRELDLEAYL